LEKAIRLVIRKSKYACLINGRSSSCNRFGEFKNIIAPACGEKNNQNEKRSLWCGGLWLLHFCQAFACASSFSLSEDHSLIKVHKFGLGQRVRLCGYLLGSLFLSLVSQALHAQAVSISDGGTPSYGYPIAMPPGLGGMVPNIGLLYSGSAVNGPVGYGWTIQGISTITRCASTKNIDGVSLNVNYGVNDKLCLDGQRLIQTDANGVVVDAANTNPGIASPFQQNDSQGGTGLVREYRTEKDIYARIRAYGAAGGDPANGPAYFKVWTKSGQIYEYGVNSNATSNALITAGQKTLVVAWAASRISDTVGNYIDFQYQQRDVAWGSLPNLSPAAPGHEWNLSEIRYTGNGSQLPVNKVVFEYVDRADTPGTAQDRAEAFHQGSKNVSIWRLNAIRTYIGWPADQSGQPASAIKVKTVKLSYDNGPMSQRSRLKQIVDCAGMDESECLPAVTFNYSAGGDASYIANAAFAGSPLASLSMQTQAGNHGVLTGNFFGTGRTDILRWSDNPAENQLYRSVGDGTFSQAGNFNITDQNLFKSDGCISAIAADINGDGLTDILRTMNTVNASGTSCGTVRNILYTSNGDGTFTAQDIGIDLSQLTSTKTTYYSQCGNDNVLAAGTLRATTLAAAIAPVPAKVGPSPQSCVGGKVPDGTTSQTAGNNFFLVDINNDGLLDLITTHSPGYLRTSMPPTDAAECAGIVCTHVYMNQGGGNFAEGATNLAQRSVYAPPFLKIQNTVHRPYTGDVNGDGYADLVVDSGTWISRGDGNFDLSTATAGGNCQYMFDFNGDGRDDCVSVLATTPLVQQLYVADGTFDLKFSQNFNLVNAGQELLGYADPNFPTVPLIGIAVADIDGDGRADILRWEDDPSKNTVYLSNGDGQFRNSNFNLTTSADQLQKSDGTASFVLGDFTGHGNNEILRLSTGSNALYVKTDSTPQDQLQSVVSSTGLVTALTWVPISNSNSGNLGLRYSSDRGTSNAAVYPAVDLTMPMYVVATSTADNGVGSNKTVSEYAYGGLKSSYDGRGWLGFRTTLRQNPAPNSQNLTVYTQNLQVGNYIGPANMTETRLGELNIATPTVISRTTNIYCDKNTADGNEGIATSDAPCPANSALQRPYLYQSTEEGWDPGNGAPLPTVVTTNAFDNGGNPTSILVATSGTALGMTQSFTKTTTNQYLPDNTANDTWILGRLSRSTVAGDNRDLGFASTQAAAKVQANAKLRSVKAAATPDGTLDNINGITTLPGSSPTASAIQGVVFAVQVTPNPAVVAVSAAGPVSASVTAVATGGIAPYTYRWTQVSGTRTTISSNTAANPVISATLALNDNVKETWRVTAADASGANVTADVPVDFSFPPAPLTFNITPVNLVAAFNDPGLVTSGVVNSNVTGGIAPYSYAWSRINGTFSTISSPTDANPTFSATLTAGQSITEVWQLIVTDATGTTVRHSYGVRLEVAPTLAVTPPAPAVVYANTAGVASTALSLTVAGGVAPFTYQWVRTAGTVSSTTNGAVINPVISATLAKGQTSVETWTATVSDAAGHTASASVNLTFSYPVPMTLSFSPTALALTSDGPGPASGVFNPVLAGGVAPYTYSWTHASGTRSGVSSSTVANPTVSAALVAGDAFTEQWKLTVTDSSGASIATAINTTWTELALLTVTPPAARTVAVTTTNIGTSTLTTTVTGGRTPYTYAWTRTGGSISTISNAALLSPVISATIAPNQTTVETWTIVVTDALGNTASGSTATTFSEPAAAMGLTFSPTALTVAVNDPGVASGVPNPLPTGGVAPYTYSWVHTTGTRTGISNAAVLSPTISVTLAAGDSVADVWTLTVTDSVGKTIAKPITTTFTALPALAITAPVARSVTVGTTGVATSVLTTTAATGGKAPYTYGWARTAGTTSTTANAAVLSPTISATLIPGQTSVETWTVTATDAVGHTASSSTNITFTYPAAAMGLTFNPTALTVTANDPGVASGVVNPVPTGGVVPYTYSWAHTTGTRTSVSNAAVANPTVSVTLGAGDSVADVWTLTVTDSVGKSIAKPITTTFTSLPTLVVTPPAARTVTVTTGTTTTALTTTVTGGKAPYTYAWVHTSGTASMMTAPTALSPTLTGTVVPAQTAVEVWTVTATDAVGHTATGSTQITFTEAAAAMTLVFNPTAVTVAANDPGVASGVITPVPAGGVVPYTYSWAHTTGTRSSLSSLSAANPTVSADLVAGDSFTDAWTLTVTDSVGKSIAKAVNVTFTALPQLAITAPAARSVTIGSTGVGTSLLTTTAATGGKAPYTYNWTRTAGTLSTISNAALLSPTVSATLILGQTSVETWTVTATDALGHTASSSTNITFNYPATAMALVFNPTAVAIIANDPGVASLVFTPVPSGGVAPYTYSWIRLTGTRSSVSSATVASPTVSATLVAGDSFAEQWQLTVTDSVGTSIAKPITATFSALPQMVVTPAAARTVAVTSTGTASTVLSTTVTGGKAPYTYLWTHTAGTASTASSTTAASATITGKVVAAQTAVETWTVTVTDSVGHVLSGSTDVTFSEPPAALALVFNPTTLTVAANDPGLASGIVNPVPSGGVAPYTYSWAHTTGTRTSVSNAAAANPTVSVTLGAGDSVTDVWTLTVTDSAGTSIAKTITTAFTSLPALAVTPPADKTVTVTTGTATTPLTTTVTGGKAPYTYAWVHTSGTASTMTAPTTLSPTLTGTVTAAQTSVELWTITVTDAVGHTATGTTAITFAEVPAAMGLTFSPTALTVAANDPGLASGVANPLPTGGVVPYSYSWVHTTGTRTAISNPTAANPTVSVVLAAGDSVADVWTLTVNDSVGKSIAKPITTTFTSLPALVMTAPAAKSVQLTSGVGSTVLTTTAATGGKAPYTYSWTHTGGSASTTANAAILSPTISATLTSGQTSAETWTVTATDAVGHTAQASTVVTFNYAAAAMTLVFSPTAVTVAANDPGLASGVLTPVPGGGVAPYTYSWAHTSGTRSSLSSPAVATPTVSATLLAGDSFSEVWTLTVTDSVGSSIAKPITVTFTALPALKATPPVDRTVVVGTTNTATTVLTSTVTGGKTPYTYAWSRTAGTTSTTANAAVLSPTISATLTPGQTTVETWTLNATDALGHTATGSTDITFTSPNPVAVVFSPTSVAVSANDPGLASGSFNPVVSGGVPPYSYSWAHTTGTRSSLSSTVVSNPTVSATLVAGDAFTDDWTLTVTDSVGKTGTKLVAATFTALAKLAVTAPIDRTVAIGTTGTVGSIVTPTVTGGKGPYTYLWTRTAGTVSTISSATVASPTISATLEPAQSAVETWSVTVNDSVGHTATDSITLTFTRASDLAVKFSPTTVTVSSTDAGPASTVLSPVVTGGTAPYSYSWTASTQQLASTLSSTTAANPTLSATVVAGTSDVDDWTVKVTDAVGSTASGTVVVDFVTLPTLKASMAATSTLTANVTTGAISAHVPVTASGGQSPYTYSWVRLSGSRSVISDPTINSPIFTATMALGETVTEVWQVTVADAIGHSVVVSGNVVLTDPAPALVARIVATTTSTGLTTQLPKQVGPVAYPGMTATGTGGIPPYSYAWTHVTGGLTTISATNVPSVIVSTNLAAGDFVSEQWKVTVSDSVGTTATATVTTAFNLPALSFSGCTTTTTTAPTVATLKCSVTNISKSGTVFISYPAISGMTVSGPSTGANNGVGCATNALCGTVTLTTGTTAGVYTGTLVAATANGISATEPFSLTVNPAIAAQEELVLPAGGPLRAGRADTPDPAISCDSDGGVYSQHPLAAGAADRRAKAACASDASKATLGLVSDTPAVKGAVL
jgi:hypothetical protein